jgi:CRP/FNR family cyclic AMP-dependent transcriptional regulator
MNGKQIILNKAIMFASINPSKLEAISQRVFEKHLDRDEIILNEGAEADALYFVAEGVVKIFKTSSEGKEQIIALMRPGDFFNDVPMFDHGPAPANAQAMGLVVLYGIQKTDLEIMLKQYPEIAINMLRMMASRVRYLISLVEDLSFRSVTGRVAKILLENYTSENQPGHRLTQRDMAAMAGTAREVISRSLKYLENNGIIRMERHRIVIKNKIKLMQMVEPAY